MRAVVENRRILVENLTVFRCFCRRLKTSKNFPRTTAGRGPAIILTYNSRLNENRLAHEFGHLLLIKGDAHENKKEKDLMHENSRGGYYLNEMECNDISENIMTLIN